MVHNTTTLPRSASESSANLKIDARDLHALATMDQSVALYDREGSVLYWNRASETLFGQSLDAVRGRTLWSIFPDAAGNEFHRAFEQVVATGKPATFEHHYVPWDRWFDNQIFAAAEGIYVVATETTQRRRLEAALASEHAKRTEEAALHETLHRVASVINSALDYETVVQRVTDEARAMCGAAFGAFFYNIADAAGQRYTLYTLSGAPREAFERFGMPRNTDVFAPTFAGEGIVRSDDITKDPRYGKNAPHHGMPKGHLPVRSYLAVPVLSKDNTVLGGLFFGHPEPGVFDARHETLLAGVAVHASIALDNAALYRQAQGAREGAELVARASRELGVTFDVEQNCQTLADLFVPHWCDVAMVFLASEGQSVRPVASASAPGVRIDALRDANAAFAPRSGIPVGPARAIRTGESQAFYAINDEMLADFAQGDEALLAALRDLRPTSSMTVPLRSQSRVVGALVLYSLGTRRIGTGDVRVVEEIGSRAAIAVESARLFDSAQRERQRAEEASRAKDEFLAVVSHELRTPMNAILGWSKMLAGGLVDGDRVHRAAVTIERNARAQAQLIEDLLDISRIITGKLRIDVQPVDIVAVVEAALDVVRPAAEAKGVRLQPMLAADAGSLLGDADRLRQVVWNLLANAVKFTPRGGRVSVRAERTDSACVITVEDTGIGIASDFLPFVFERFRQADTGTTRAQGGLGLGLAIVRHLAEQHGGTIEAASDGLGQGARFTVRLPVTPLRTRETPTQTFTHAPPVEASTAPFCPPEVEGLSVLVVDDEPDARDLLVSLLTSCKARVTAASDAADAYERVRELKPDVLVSDVGMPDEDGYRLIERIRALPHAEGGATPAVALTAYARAEDRTRALLAGFNMHVAKPVDPSELLVVIASLASRGAKRP